MLHLVHICFLFFTWILKVLISKSHIKIKENALTFHNIISFFQHEKKHEHTMLYFPYLLDELKNTYQQTIYQNRRNHLDAVVIHLKEFYNFLEEHISLYNIKVIYIFFFAK